ncbi:MAG: MBOAT family protein [Planctomycetes bacterium]|nr:MBOAT family protein [Planctomycetota bacterium]
MLFNSFEYVILLWVCYVLFWTLKQKRSLRHALLLIASWLFYSWADWRFTWLLLASTALDYGAGLGIAAGAAAGDARRKRLWMAASLVGNLGLLGFYKYYDFFTTSFQAAFAKLGLHFDPWLLGIAVPAGISFYTFQTLSYTIDVYRGTLKPCRSLLDFALFVAFFPQLVAGPIVRASDFLPQLERPPLFDAARVSSGLFQILRGLLKKLLMADILGTHIVDPHFRDQETLGQLGGWGMLLVTYAYALQLYGDFAGYSDIAIGSARLFGFELMKNFDAPFRSKSLEEFWSRWHISMSTWFQDYVYVWMGGSRVGFWRGCRNVFIAWTLVGLWHGAAWTYVLWGAYHGAWLVLVRLLRKHVIPGGKFQPGLRTTVLGTLFAFHVVAFSMILFRCRSLGDFTTACAQFTDWSRALPVLPWQLWLILALGVITHCLPEGFVAWLERLFHAVPSWLQGLGLATAIVLLFALHPPGLAPFIYFQF